MFQAPFHMGKCTENKICLEEWRRMGDNNPSIHVTLSLKLYCIDLATFPLLLRGLIMSWKEEQWQHLIPGDAEPRILQYSACYPEGSIWCLLILIRSPSSQPFLALTLPHKTAPNINQCVMPKTALIWSSFSRKCNFIFNSNLRSHLASTDMNTRHPSDSARGGHKIQNPKSCWRLP